MAAGLILGIGLDAGDTGAFFKITNDFVLSGIALGTIVVIARLPPGPPGGGRIGDDEGAMISVGGTDRGGGPRSATPSRPHRSQALIPKNRKP